MDLARFRCMCGNTHSVPMAKALNGIGVAHWRCTDCRRRFVLAQQEDESFIPIYLDPGVRSIELRETGSADPEASMKNPMPPPAIEFKCRCSAPMTAHSWMYGGTAVCPGCKCTLYLALKYNVKRKMYVISPEYPHTVTRS